MINIKDRARELYDGSRTEGDIINAIIDEVSCDMYEMVRELGLDTDELSEKATDALAKFVEESVPYAIDFTELENEVGENREEQAMINEAKKGGY